MTMQDEGIINIFQNRSVFRLDDYISCENAASNKCVAQNAKDL